MPTGLCLERGCVSPVCMDELDSARGFPQHCPPQVRSVTGATTLLVWGMQDPLLAGGLPKLEWVQRLSHGVYLQRVGKGWGRAGTPSPFFPLPAPPKPILWPHETVQGMQWSAAGMFPKPCLGDGEEDGTWRPPTTPQERAAAPGLASPLLPCPVLPPALGLAHPGHGPGTVQRGWLGPGRSPAPS